MRISETEKKEFVAILKELFAEDKLYEMADFIQHGNTTTLTHCLMVAYYSYTASLHLPVSFDVKSIVRGAMLHDFYLYDWHIPDRSHRLHGFVHPGFALKNARKYYKLNSIEEDIIEKHMWPMTIHKLPKYRETFLVSSVDKFISLAETLYLPVMPKDYRYFLRSIKRNKAEWG